MQPMVLCVNMQEGRLMRLSFAAMSLGIQVKGVREAQYGQTLGALCGLDAEAAHPPKARVEEEMMVMAFFDEGLMERFFTALRQGGQEVPALKAVLTPTNRAWHCGRLFQQLRAEHAVMRAARRGRGD